MALSAGEAEVDIAASLANLILVDRVRQVMTWGVLTREFQELTKKQTRQTRSY